MKLFGRILAVASALAGSLAFGASPALAQADTVTIVPSPRYEAGSLHRSLLGSHYRDLWTTPIRVELLDLGRVAGGLTPVELGGGRQTSSLRFRGADGREYAFRSVDKWPHTAQDPDLDGALLADLIEDQVSSLVPGAPVVAGHLSATVGVLAARPRLYVMPDDPALGEFRSAFAGMLGTFEERANEHGDGAPGFGGFSRITATDRLLERLEESPRHRADERAYLAARLFDLFLGDWDRHEGQWRWAERERADGSLWIPIAQDRDYVFADYDGHLMDFVRRAVPNAVRFGPEISHLDGLALNARNLDRRLLSGLDRAVWDSVAATLVAALTDEAIDEALRQMPAEFYALRGAELNEELRGRRERLIEASRAFYAMVAEVTEVRATDEDESVEIVRFPDGSVNVSMTAPATSPLPYFERTFHPDETREIRLYLQGGDDRAVIRGTAARGILVRVIGGGGRDELVDSSRVARSGRWTSLHDSGADDTLLAGPRTVVDRHEYTPPEAGRRGLIRIPTVDYGSSFSISPSADYSTTRGFVLGGRATFTRRSFRRDPHASSVSVGVRYSTRWSHVELRGGADAQLANPDRRISGRFVASAIDATRFYGFGNESAEDVLSSQARVRRDLVSAEAWMHQRVGADLTIAGGPVLRLSRPRLEAGSPLELLRPLGSDGFGALGLDLSVTRPEDARGEAPRILGFDLGAAVFPILWNGEGSYGDVRGKGSAILPLSRSGTTRATLVAGGRHVWGSYPYFDAAYLGGRRSLRGYPQWRFAGDAMVHGSAEVATPLARLPLLLNWRVDPFAFIDVGRVFLAGERSNRWHSTPGLGLSLTAVGYALRVTYAQGPSGRVYLDMSAAR